VNVNLNATSHEKGIIVDHARIRGKLAALRAFVFGHPKIVERIIPRKRRDAGMNFITSGALEREH
jgi:hypothetical protein